ncbi:unnamed protein product [Didymodactylos carnosus]|uniref:ADP-ribosylation factor n=1 Tax=Didymodactylos carnosus TaxID=1234261 RepID=A0A815RLD7_9BILA|nr:unnamed protein product [Didymodactylos carnosus]CAF1479114.1 unnamed protein product [Didymodactylos carnosus]CAF4140114.1 unnamed protein product [Didymodactylos carnosus]CAF4344493.1 unnamed protein product [Didymodactylos carnosus]
MGLYWTKALSTFKKEEIRVLMCGLDAAGKTTVLYVSKLGEVVTTIPTIGFNVETITIKNIDITAWDVGGRDKIRPLWRHYYQNTKALIFVIDSNDRERLSEAQEELHRMCSELKDIPVLILANKQDLPNAMSKNELIEKLKLNTMTETGIKWHIQETCASQNIGIEEGFNWLVDAFPPADLIKPIDETINDAWLIKTDLINSFKASIKLFQTLFQKSVI